MIKVSLFGVQFTMARPFGNRNTRPGADEQRQLIATLRKNAEQGDSLACLALLLATKNLKESSDEKRLVPDVCD